MSLLNKPDIDAINCRGENMKARTYLSGFLFREIKYSMNPENVTIIIVNREPRRYIYMEPFTKNSKIKMTNN